MSAFVLGFILGVPLVVILGILWLMITDRRDNYEPVEHADDSADWRS